MMLTPEECPVACCTQAHFTATSTAESEVCSISIKSQFDQDWKYRLFPILRCTIRPEPIITRVLHHWNKRVLSESPILPEAKMQQCMLV